MNDCECCQEREELEKRLAKRGLLIKTDHSFVLLEGQVDSGHRPVITIEDEGYMVIHGSVPSAWLLFLHLGWIALAAALLIL